MEEKIVLLYLYDTCNLDCGYCGLAKNNYTNDYTQLEFYQDVLNINKISKFFVDRNDHVKWHIKLTGGESLLMPNFNLFCDVVGKDNKISLYTNLLLPSNHPNFMYLIDNASIFDTVIATLHPEGLKNKEKFFNNVKMLKNNGINTIVKIILHPKLIDILEEVNLICKELDVLFMPMPLLSQNYPKKYTLIEKSIIMKYISILKQVIHLNGGLNVGDMTCNAGSKLLNIDARNGNIYPCADVTSPTIGNIYEDTINYLEPDIQCLKENKFCMCDIHYEDGIINDFSLDHEVSRIGYIEFMTEDKILNIINEYKLKFNNNNSFPENGDESVLIYKDPSNLNSFAKNITSQFGEDGVIEYLFSKIGISNDAWCVEFGAWDGEYLSNTYNLVFNQGFNCVYIEGDQQKAKDLRKKVEKLEKQKIFVLNNFVESQGENALDSLLAKTDIPNEFDLLSIDIDGIDYHVWKNFKKYNPKIVLIEHNPTIPPHIEYIPEEKSSLTGASTLALYGLGKLKGYELVCCTDTNSIFVRKDLFGFFNIQDNTPKNLMKTDHITYLISKFDGSYLTDKEPAFINIFDDNIFNNIKKPISFWKKIRLYYKLIKNNRIKDIYIREENFL